jgi:UV DNA damage repair endonuclease
MILSKTPHQLGYVYKAGNESTKSNFLDNFFSILDKNSKLGLEVTCVEIAGKEDFIPDFLNLEEEDPENKILDKISLFLRNHPQRIFFLIPNYYFLGTQLEEVHKESVLLLNKIAYLIEYLGIKTPSIIIRLGSAYGNRKETIARFNSRVKSLPVSIKKLLLVTNDEKPSLFSVTDLLSGVYYETKLPICFRLLPHQFNSGGLSIREALFLSCSTWPSDLKPIFIHAESKEIDENGQSISAIPADFLRYRIPTFGLNIDVVVDSPQAEKCCHQYLSESRSLKPMVINKIAK